MFTEQEKKERREARKLERARAKEFERLAQLKAQKPIKSMTITIEWSRSRMWGMNPHASARIEYHDGHYSHIDGYTASGCGYDKESTVIAEIFNDTLRYELFRRIRKAGGSPYGMYYYGGKYKDDGSQYISFPCYNGGVGTSCYFNISKFIGGKFENVSSGKTFDVFKYTDKKRKKKEVKPTKEEIQEYMELHNADEVGIDCPWTLEDAEYHLLLSDKYYYKEGKP